MRRQQTPIMRATIAGLALSLVLGGAGCATLSGVWPGTSKGPAGPPVAASAESRAPLRSPAGNADESARLCLAVADDLEKAGHLREAALQLELARQYQPKLNISARLARLHQAAGEAAAPRDQAVYFQKAIAEYQKALAAGGSTPELLNDLGYCLYQKGSPIEAELYFRQALEKNPKLTRAWINLGLALGAQGKEADALAAFTRVVTPAEAHCNLAYLYLKHGRADVARQHYVLALRQNPHLKLAQERLAALDAVTGQVQTAAATNGARSGATPGRADAHVVPADWRPAAAESTPPGLGAPQRR